MEDKKSKKASDEQKEFLVSYMEENLEFAQERFESSDGAHLKFAKWEMLATALNSVGGARKDVNQWRKFWRDQKLHIKEKEALLKSSFQKSGVNGLKKLKSLTPFEERVLGLLAPASVSGSNVRELLSITQLKNKTSPTSNKASNDPHHAETNDDDANMIIEVLDEEEEEHLVGTSAMLTQSFPTITPTEPSAMPTARKRKSAPSGKEYVEKNTFEEKILKIEEEKLNYIRKNFEIQEKKFIWKKQFQEQLLELQRKKLELKESKMFLQK